MIFAMDKYLNVEREVFIKKLEKLTKSLQNARDENTTLRATTRKGTREERVEKTMMKVFERNVKKITPTKYAGSVVSAMSGEPQKGNVVTISDWHIGEEVNEEEVGFTNKYNYVESNKRLKRYISKIISCNITKSKDLTIADLGDNIRGIIHEGVYDTEDGLMTSIVKAVEMTCMFISEMLEHYDKIDYYFVVGNHSRLEDSIKSKHKYRDYSWLIIKMVEKMYANEKRLRIHISKSGYHLVKINGANLFMFHGDTVRGYNPLTETAQNKMQGICNDLFGRSAKHFLSGHTHKAVTVQNRYGGLNIVSGTLVGNNEYGVQSGFGTIQASQPMFNINSKGDIEEIIHFKLKD